MPHGDFSDLAALGFVGLGAQHIFFPALHFRAFPPFRPVFDAKMTPELEAMIRSTGGFQLIFGFALSTVRWNTINGKLTGLGCMLASANMARACYKLPDKEGSMLRPPYVVAGMLLLTGLKLMFFANEMPKKSLNSSEEIAAKPAKKPLALVTGGIMGIGYFIAGQLAREGYHIIIADLQVERGEETMMMMRKKYGKDISVEVERLDLSSFADTEAYATKFAERFKELPVLVCNAGIGPPADLPPAEKQLSKDGVQVLYQINFLSHFLLILKLMPLLKAAHGRVVSVASVMHRQAVAEHLDLTTKVVDENHFFYGLSKMAQIASSYELHRRFGTEVAFHTANPGGVATALYDKRRCYERCFAHSTLIGPEVASRGAFEACIDKAAAAPAAPTYRSSYRLSDRWEKFEYWSPLGAGKPVMCTPTAISRDEAFQQKLWVRSISAIRDAGVKITGDGQFE